METNHTYYDFEKSRSRIDEILDESDKSFEELDSIPSRDKLTYKNGFYVNCTALFVDIRDSSILPTKHKRPALAKIYRSYISEVVAVMNGNLNCKEIEIDGDCISGIYNTPSKADIDSVFNNAYTISSILRILNCKFEKRGIENINIGIGIDYGRALMIKAGYNGSGLNKVVWMGDVVNSASNLCNKANKGWDSNEIFVSEDIFNNLNEQNQKLLSWNQKNSCYHGDVINTGMEEWYQNNCTNKNNSNQGLGLAQWQIH
jgi:class 3 adenylate cyclase